MAMRAVGDLQAGNWCMMLFYIRDTDAARAKLDAVKAFSPNPLRPPKLGLDPFLMDVALHKSLAYLWRGSPDAAHGPPRTPAGLERTRVRPESAVFGGAAAPPHPSPPLLRPFLLRPRAAGSAT